MEGGGGGGNTNIEEGNLLFKVKCQDIIIKIQLIAMTANSLQRF